MLVHGIMVGLSVFVIVLVIVYIYKTLEKFEEAKVVLTQGPTGMKGDKGDLGPQGA